MLLVSCMVAEVLAVASTEPAGVPVTTSRSSRELVLVPVLLPPELCMFPCMVVLPVACCVVCSPVPMLVFVASFVDAVPLLVIVVSSVAVSVVVDAHAPTIRQKTARAIKGVFLILLYLLLSTSICDIYKNRTYFLAEHGICMLQRMENLIGRFAPQLYAILRIVAGLMFAMHGTQKLFGWPGGKEPAGVLLYQVAGVIELVGGLLIAIGLFTGFAAFISSGQMAAAYFMSHARESFWPLLNRGELTVLYCFLFLYMAAHGAGIWSVDAARRGRTPVTPAD